MLLLFPLKQLENASCRGTVLSSQYEIVVYRAYTEPVFERNKWKQRIWILALKL